MAHKIPMFIQILEGFMPYFVIIWRDQSSQSREGVQARSTLLT